MCERERERKANVRARIDTHGSNTKWALFLNCDFDMGVGLSLQTHNDQFGGVGFEGEVKSVMFCRLI